MPEPSDVIELRNSPGIPITITRGGTDPITGEALSDQFVTVTWEETYTETTTPDDGEAETVERTRTVSRYFLGPA